MKLLPIKKRRARRFSLTHISRRAQILVYSCHFWKNIPTKYNPRQGKLFCDFFFKNVFDFLGYKFLLNGN